MCGWDKDHTMGVSSLANEKPLVVVKACINVVWEIIREDCGSGVIRKGEAPLHHSGCGSVFERSLGAKNGDVGQGWGGRSHWRSKVLTSRGGDKDIIRIDGDVLVERGEEKGVEDFLSYSGGGGRHC